MSDQALAINVVVNGAEYATDVEPRLLLTDFLRHKLRLTGTHVGCEHGVCGACTVLIDGEPQRACLVFAAQADGCEIATVEGLAAPDEPLHPVQQAFHETHGMQCGFCTSGFLMTVTALLRDTPHPSDEQVIDALGGNICRCTGYKNIVAAVRRAEELLAGGEAVPAPDAPPTPTTPSPVATEPTPTTPAPVAAEAGHG
ncbi:MAG TPA: (2Fe-2S)-binding protein [Conexibacter sp.]|jgi:carbon-monoxide dehydrogenase small subunit